MIVRDADNAVCAEELPLWPSIVQGKILPGVSGRREHAS
jgi:hypothetical protein